MVGEMRYLMDSGQGRWMKMTDSKQSREVFVDKFRISKKTYRLDRTASLRSSHLIRVIILAAYTRFGRSEFQLALRRRVHSRATRGLQR